jgi:cytochrome c556
MTWCLRSALAAAVVAAVAAGFAPAAPAQDSSQILKDRQALMKQQAKDLGTIKAYFTGKADQAAAETAATGLTGTMQKIPDMFPPGSAGTSPDGKYAAKPAIWTEWDKFLGARKNAAGKVDVLLAAIKSGDKQQIQAAFADLGKNGCGGCHGKFREEIKK